MAVANQQHDLVAVTVSDPREQALPDVGFISLATPRPARSWRSTRATRRCGRCSRGRAAAGPRTGRALKKAGVDQLAIRTDEDYQKSSADSST